MRERFYRVLMEDYADNPRTILLSTHLIDEIAMVVERVYIMSGGKIVMEDEVDRIRSRSYLLRGANEALARFTSGKRVIYRESYGSGAIAAVFDTIGDQERQEAGRLGISVDELPLQKFFAYLVEGGERVG
jgi:ABC-2 type transport system ATP-binding protein